MARPNIIFILCDQMRFDAVGAYGNECVQTPNIDWLSAKGTRFDHAYSSVPSCIPARASLWTGQDQWHTGVLGMGKGQGPIPHDFPHTLASELTGAGYQTHMVGKGHFHPQHELMGFESTELDESGRCAMNGFDDAYRAYFKTHAPQGMTPDDHGVNWNSWHARPWHTSEHLHPTAWTGTRAIEWLKQRDKERPFFLNISFARPHSPYVPPQPYWDQYINEKTPPAAVGDWAARHDDPMSAADPNAWQGRMTAQNIHRARAGYYGECAFIDSQVGRLLNWMDRFEPAGLRNTWFVFASDHGDMLGDHNLWRKTYAYEGSAHIPLIITPPATADAPKIAAADQVVELRDIMPTILEAAGLNIPDTVIGSSMLPLMASDTAPWRPYLHGEHSTCYAPEQEMHYVTDGHRKYIWFPRINIEQFFNLDEDPHECCDLAAAPSSADEVAKWRDYLIDELARRDCGWVVDGKLHCPPDTPLISPYRDQRWNGDAPSTKF